MLASSKVPTSKTVEPSRAPKSWLRNSLERAPTSKMTAVGPRTRDGRRAARWSSRRAGAAKMSHRPTIVSLHVEARILLTTVAGRSSMDRMAEGIEHMVIETLLFIAFVVMVGAAVVKAYEWHHDVLYGPYIKAGRLKQRPR